MTLADFKRQQAEARQTMRALQKLYPGAFNADGSARVATLTFPRTTRPSRATDGGISHTSSQGD